MQKESLSFRDTGYFSSLICDYLDNKEALKPFYNRFPSVENFKLQIEEKQKLFSIETRAVLVKALQRQYSSIETSEITLQNIEALKDDKTFTITTGHQLNLFTGPLYFLYKIVSAINLSIQLKEQYPNYNFVPVYWMATEDHDFDEINYFNFRGKKVSWNTDASGAVGRLNTKGLVEVFEAFSKELGSSFNEQNLKKLFKEAYLKHNTLTKATRFLANHLFKKYGLVIIDGDDKQLKELFVPYIKEELLQKRSYKAVTVTSENILSSNYKVQVNPRDINLFYLDENLRERIIFEDDVFKVNNTNISWNEEDVISHLKNAPECFSPNVIMRPLYQEVILPNLCYIGGGGELAYWFQLKDYFKNVGVTFPILLLRNSVLVKTRQQAKKLEKLNISNQDLFLKQNNFINKKVREISNINIDFSTQKKHLIKQFEELYKLAEQTDKSFLGAVGAQEKKQLKGIDHLENRLLKAQKRKLADEVMRMVDLQNALFPNQSLQERNANFSELYLEYGDSFIEKLIDNLNPLESQFTVLNL